MTELVSTKIGKIQLLLFAVVIVMLLFGGCGQQDLGNSAGLEDMAMSMSGGVDINTIGTGEWMESQGMDGAGDWYVTGSLDGGLNLNGSEYGMEPKPELNPNETSIIYQGTTFMSSCRTIGGDSIYSTGFLGEFDGEHPAEGSYFAGRIGIEGNAIQQFALEIPEGMFAYRGCIDSQGRWHLLLSQQSDDTTTDKKTEIWVINRQGELEQSVDITESVKGGNRIPYWMAVDFQGNYYLASEDKILVIDLGKQSAETLQFEEGIIGMGIGRSGSLYGVFNVDGNDFLGIVDTDSGSIEKCADLPENGMRPSFSELQAGVRTELLLANKGEGVWSYDGTELKQVLSLKNIAANGQDIIAMGFLWDGRVCIMSYEDGKYVFRYVPAEV